MGSWRGERRVGVWAHGGGEGDEVCGSKERGEGDGACGSKERGKGMRRVGSRRWPMGRTLTELAEQ